MVNPTTPPLVSLPEVGSNEEGRNKVASTPGSITQLSAAWADGEQSPCTVSDPHCRELRLCCQQAID